MKIPLLSRFMAQRDGRKPISVSLTYPVPVVVKTHMGGTPNNYFSKDPTVKQPYVECKNNSCGALPQEVYRWEPLLNADGSPMMRNVTKKLEDVPANPLGSFVTWGGVGAAVAGCTGLLIGAVVGQPVLGAVVGGAIGLLGPGSYGAFKANGDRIRLDWQVLPIITEEYTGYRETAKPAVVQGQSGYVHQFTPSFERQQIAVYKVPQIVHYREVQPPPQSKN
jgi:hypothetical protein